MYGIVLEGGGAKGAYHVGAFKAINELGIEYKGVAGTSVGALNGAMIVQGDFEKAYDFWRNIKPSSIFNIDEEQLKKLAKMEFNPYDFLYFFNIIKSIIKNKGIDTSKLKSVLKNHINEDKIRKSKIDFGIVTVSLSDLKPLELYIQDIPQGELVDYLLASANLPIFKTEIIKGKKFMDGSIYDNCPISLLTKKGYKDIIVLRTFGFGRYKKNTEKDANIIKIKPSVDLPGVLNFDNTLVKNSIYMGYYDTLKYFNNLLGTKFYIKLTESNLFEKILLKLDEKTVLEIGKILGFKNTPYRRMLFEFIIPRFVRILELERNNNYEMIVTSILEKMAEELNIDRFKIYSFEELRKTVLTIIKNNKKNNLKEDKFMNAAYKLLE